MFLGRAQDTVIGRFKLAVASPDAVVTFSGPAGVGKTTLAAAAVRATSTRLAVAWLSSVPTNATELLEQLLVELGMNAHRTTRIERLQMWRQYLSELSATASRVFVIAERTEELSPEVLRALDSLTAADANGCPGANVVLLGRPGLDQFLAASELDSLRQRIRLRQRLEAFSAAELGDYLRHRVARAGGEFDRVFAPGAAAAVHRYSGGIVRVANSLCETALGVAAAERRPQITADLIAEVAIDILGIAESSSVATPPQPSSQATEPKPMRVEPVAAAPAPTPTPTAAIAVTRIDSPAPSDSVATPPPAVAAAPPPVEVTATAPPVASSASPPPAARSSVIAPPVIAPPPVAAPVAVAPSVWAPAPAPIVERPRAAPAVAKRSEPVTTPRVAPPYVAFESPPTVPTHSDFDATATDIPDLSSIDFPVLTDAVEGPPATSRPSRTTERLQPTAAPVVRPPQAPPAPMARAAASRPAAPAAQPAMPAARRTTEALPPKPAAPSPPMPPPRAVEPKRPVPSTPAAPPAAVDEDADLLHHTQTMRALSIAKSIDDVSDSMAETLFGEADLDALSAALASAGFSDGTEEREAPARSAPSAPPPTESTDDILDLFNLGPDAPLELIDDSATPPTHQPRTGTRRR